MAARGGGSGRSARGAGVESDHHDGGRGSGAGARPKVALSVMKAALAAAGVPTAGLLERAEFEALYWRLQEEEGGGDGARVVWGVGTPCPLSPSRFSW